MWIWHKKHFWDIFFERIIDTEHNSTLINCIQNWISCNCKIIMSCIFPYIHLHMTNDSLLGGMFAGSISDLEQLWILSNCNDVISVQHGGGGGGDTTKVLVLPKIINTNILKTLYSSTDFPALVFVSSALAPALWCTTLLNQSQESRYSRHNWWDE